MKKLLILSLAVVMVAAFTLPASAFESVFGGYWRTRAVHQQNFSGDTSFGAPSDSGVSRVDTRTRLYYTAILNDNLKFVNKFEFDAVWGSGGADGFKSYGDFGADNIAIEIKETYVDTNIGPIRAKIGVHDRLYARGFIYADEFSGVTLSFKAGDVLIPFTWMKGFEGGTNLNSQDVDFFGLDPFFNFGEAFTLNPFAIYAYSKNGGPTTGFSTLGQNSQAPGVNDGIGVYWLGANVDATLGSVGLWFTGVYQGGKLDDNAAGADNLDVKAYLLAGGASVPLGPASLHGQVFYASGDDDATDSDLEAFFGIGGGGVGWAYYWSEIMGLGTFDNQFSAGSPNGDVSNMWAANIGATIKPMEKLSLTGDIWYASLVEDNVADNKKLGIEIDLAANYQLAEGLNMRVVGAYLFADNATQTADAAAADVDNSDDPWEVGTQLSLSF